VTGAWGTADEAGGTADEAGGVSAVVAGGGLVSVGLGGDVGCWLAGAGAGTSPLLAGGAPDGAGAGVELTPGDGAVGLLSELSPIATAAPTRTTATAVLMMITAGRRYQGRIGCLGFAAFDPGVDSRSKVSCGRAEVSPEPSPLGTARDASSASDQAKAGCMTEAGAAPCACW